MCIYICIYTYIYIYNDLKSLLKWGSCDLSSDASRLDPLDPLTSVSWNRERDTAPMELSSCDGSGCLAVRIQWSLGRRGNIWKNLWC